MTDLQISEKLLPLLLQTSDIDPSQADFRLDFSRLRTRPQWDPVTFLGTTSGQLTKYQITSVSALTPGVCWTEWCFDGSINDIKQKKKLDVGIYFFFVVTRVTKIIVPSSFVQIIRSRRMNVRMCGNRVWGRTSRWNEVEERSSSGPHCVRGPSNPCVLRFQNSRANEHDDLLRFNALSSLIPRGKIMTAMIAMKGADEARIDHLCSTKHTFFYNIVIRPTSIWVLKTDIILHCVVTFLSFFPLIFCILSPLWQIL